MADLSRVCTISVHHNNFYNITINFSLSLHPTLLRLFHSFFPIKFLTCHERAIWSSGLSSVGLALEWGKSEQVHLLPWYYFSWAKKNSRVITITWVPMNGRCKEGHIHSNSYQPEEDVTDLFFLPLMQSSLCIVLIYLFTFLKRTRFREKVKRCGRKWTGWWKWRENKSGSFRVSPYLKKKFSSRQSPEIYSTAVVLTECMCEAEQQASNSRCLKFP